eukprot:Colp12_sorted_trinity150504_noHs@19869
MSCTTILSNKRTFESMENVSPHCSPFRMHKKAKFEPASPPSPSSSPTRCMPFRARPVENTHFHSTLEKEPIDKFLVVPKKRKTKVNENEQTHHYTGAPTQNPSELLFTYDQVRAIVQRAVAEREQTIREEYDMILQQKLSEQFNSFTKFNEDYIHRRMEESQWSYMS